VFWGRRIKRSSAFLRKKCTHRENPGYAYEFVHPWKKSRGRPWNRLKALLHICLALMCTKFIDEQYFRYSWCYGLTFILVIPLSTVECIQPSDAVFFNDQATLLAVVTKVATKARSPTLRNAHSARRAGLSIVSVVLWEGPPAARGPRRSAAKFLPRYFDVWTFSVRSNVTTKKGRQLFGENSENRHRYENPGFAYEKRAPALRWYGPPEWLVRPWVHARSGQWHGWNNCHVIWIALN